MRLYRFGLSLVAATAVVLTAMAHTCGAASADARMDAGRAAMRRGDYGAAERHWSAARDTYARAGDVAGEVDSLLNLASAYQWAGTYHRVTPTLREAQSLAEANDLRLQLASIKNALGVSHTFSREPKEADRLLTEALALAEAEGAGDSVRAGILNNLGTLYAMLGEPDPDAPATPARQRTRRERELARARQEELANRQRQAQDAYERAAGLAAAGGDELLAAKALANAALSAARVGDAGRADRSNGEALDRAGDLEDSREKAFLLVTIGQTDRHLLDAGDKAKPREDDAPAEPRDAPADFDFAASRGRLLKRAAEALSLAAKVGLNVNDPLSRSYALGYLGRLYEREKRYDEALRLTRGAVDAAQRARSNDSLYLWQWQIGRLFRATNRPDDALAAYTAATASVDPIRSDIALGNGNKGMFVTFRRDVGPMLSETADLQLAAGLAEEAMNTVELLRGAELEDYLQDPCVNQFRREKVKGVREVMRDLGADSRSAVVYLIPLADRIEFILITPGGGLERRQSPVGAEQLTAQLLEFRRNLERRVSHRYMKQGRQLYDWLVRPIEDVLTAANVDTLVFVPDGALRTVPMAALHDGKQFLVAKYAVGVIPGLKLTDVKPNPLPAGEVRVLANGLSQGTDLSFAPLPSVPGELAQIQDVYGEDRADQLLDMAFTERGLEQKVKEPAEGSAAAVDYRDYSIVHIASHGVFGARKEDTFLLTYDDQLTLDELETLLKPKLIKERPVELLTLSACQTAVGDDNAALGLAGAALKVGVRSTVASLWFVSDEASSELVAQFYRELAADPTATKAQALQRAQLKMIADKDFAHPIYWAPFQVFGNWL